MTVEIPDAPDEPALLEAAARHGVGLATALQHRLLSGPPALLLGYGRVPKPSIDAGPRALVAALHDVSSAAVSERPGP